MPRLYLVEETATGQKRLIEANSQGQALMHVAKGGYMVKAASASDVYEAMTAGAKVEKAGAESPEPAAAE
jgi:hypothetical protein